MSREWDQNVINFIFQLKNLLLVNIIKSVN